MSKHVQTLYDPAIKAARQRFAASPAIRALHGSALDPELVELFLIHFSSLGVAMTEPVEDWIQRAGERCEAIGLVELGRGLRAHAQHEAGHHELMIADTHALVARWNALHAMRLDATELLKRPTTPGVRCYRELHENVIASDAPYAQLAIEYEIEMLSVTFGAELISRCAAVLGIEGDPGLSFLRDHVALDVGHTKFNEQQLEKLLEKHPDFAAPLSQAGGAALDAYAAFLGDCLQLALSETRSGQQNERAAADPVLQD